jgi:site-specific DNA recombinase
MTGACLLARVKKEKYVYYRCSGNRGKCELPHFREEDIADKLGEPLKGLQVPPEIAAQIVTAMCEDQNRADGG